MRLRHGRGLMVEKERTQEDEKEPVLMMSCAAASSLAAASSPVAAGTGRLGETCLVGRQRGDPCA